MWSSVYRQSRCVVNSKHIRDQAHNLSNVSNMNRRAEALIWGISERRMIVSNLDEFSEGINEAFCF